MKFKLPKDLSKTVCPRYRLTKKGKGICTAIISKFSILNTQF